MHRERNNNFCLALQFTYTIVLVSAYRIILFLIFSLDCNQCQQLSASNIDSKFSIFHLRAQKLDEKYSFQFIHEQRKTIGQQCELVQRSSIVPPPGRKKRRKNIGRFFFLVRKNSNHVFNTSQQVARFLCCVRKDFFALIEADSAKESGKVLIIIHIPSFETADRSLAR